ncbi:DUF397 domain-containing protein [Streptomyces xiaopingdaonensis]|uniref:DUF397 domain-containing protein n=1 Tax=Streptomyces xiaopingdaonensis TaxID=1565415 RepID=UPI0003038E46|nr:DUF397 domain-containing protein [Streptomyces xiaopingdaonensis]
MSTTPGVTQADWVKSSYSGNGGGSCVEWSPSSALHGTVPVRDSKQPGLRPLTFSTQTWTAFTSALRHG